MREMLIEKVAMRLHQASYFRGSVGVVDIEAALKLELSAHGGRLDKRLVTCLVTFRTKNKGLHRCKPLFLNGAAPGVEKYYN